MVRVFYDKYNKERKNRGIMLKKNYLLFLLLIIPVFLSAQSVADEIETLLNANPVTYAQAANFTLLAAEILTEDNAQEAFSYAVRRGWLPENVSSGDPARLSHIALLFMRSFEMRGGIMYSIFGTAHYAYRELRYLDVIQGRAVPTMYVSGEQFLFYISRLLVLQER
jgi:hypothetical protein